MWKDCDVFEHTTKYLLGGESVEGTKCIYKARAAGHGLIDGGMDCRMDSGRNKLCRHP